MALTVNKTNRKKIMDHGCCAYCGYSEDYIVVDHIFPTSLGGDSELKNLTAACVKCNSIKNSRVIEEFLSYVSIRRDIIRNRTYSYTGQLAKYKRGRLSHYPKDWLIDAIRKNRELHSYYTRIINSILMKKYLLHG